MAGRRAPDHVRIARMEQAAAEAEDVLRSGEHSVYAQAAGLRNAVAAGLAPPPSFVAGVRAALQAELQRAAARSAASEGIDVGTTLATKSTLRGVLKRFEEAFELAALTQKVPRDR